MQYLCYLVTIVAVFAILAISLNLIAGYGGMLSVAHAAFFGIGSYVTALAMMRAGLPFLAALLLSVAVTAAVALLVAIPTLRLGGDYFILATLAFQTLLVEILNNWIDLTRGPFGLYDIPRPSLFGITIASNEAYALVATVVAAALLALARRLVASPFGRTLRAIREDETVAQVLGKDVFRVKLAAFAIGAAFAAVAGSLYAPYIRFISPASFALSESFLLLTIVFVGGAGNLAGSVLGTALLLLLPEALRFGGVGSAVAAPLQQLVYGLVLILLMIYRPQGLIGEHRPR